MARLKIKIDKELVKKLALIQCTNEEIASVVGCSVDTIERNCAGLLKDGRANGRMSIKRKQYELATKGAGNCTMLIWLGKQHLSQSDNRELENAIKNAAYKFVEYDEDEKV